MKASIVDLRYRMNDVLKALSRNELVTITSHGEEKGVIVPYRKHKDTKNVEDTPLFGMYQDDKEDINNIMEQLRGGRYRDI